MTLVEVQHAVQSRALEPLPGVFGQSLMAPMPRSGRQSDSMPSGCREGAGLLLLFPQLEQTSLVLTLRDRKLAHHAGQVCLPGGAVNRGETVIQAALREAQEEIGVDPRDVRVLCQLTPLHIPVSRFILHPVLGIIDYRPGLQAAAGEVERILEVDLETLASPQKRGVETRNLGSGFVEVPFFQVEDQRVWGATAMILAELLCLLGKFNRTGPLSFHEESRRGPA